MPSLFYRTAFADYTSLKAMHEGGPPPSPEDWARHLFVLERRTAIKRPDHFYKNYRDMRWDPKNKTVVDMVRFGLDTIGKDHLEWRQDRLMVKSEKFDHWHQTAPAISPLAVASYWLYQHHGTRADAAGLKIIRQCFAHTALLSPPLTMVQPIIDQDGLVESHLHLNGSTEIDLVWIDAVGKPRNYYRELQVSYQKNKELRELYDQIDFEFKPHTLYFYLQAAQRVRAYLSVLIATPMRQDKDAPKSHDPFARVQYLATRHIGSAMPDEISHLENRHPVTGLHLDLGWPRATLEPLHAEAIWLLACFTAMDTRSDIAGAVAYGLFFTLSVQHLIIRLSVQQQTEFGFDQFQKYTNAGTRELIEKDYVRRFAQLAVSDRGDIAHLDGRFAPKKDRDGTLKLLTRIIEGYLTYRCHRCPRAKHLHLIGGQVPPCLDKGMPCAALTRDDPGYRRVADAESPTVPLPGTAPKRLALSLVVHFIKERDKTPLSQGIPQCRYGRLRRRLDDQGRMIAWIYTHSALVRRFLHGIDAASNELHAPPEPFAPLYRMMRRVGIPHATFHCGEDYEHLTAGIRAVWEAVDFCDLKDGDRVGHATALGVRPTLWRETIGEEVAQRTEDALDDAVFAYHLLKQEGGFGKTLATLAEKIETWCRTIYGVAHSPIALHQAWALRRLDARLAHLPEYFGTNFDQVRFDRHTKAELALLKAEKKDNSFFDIFLARHSHRNRARGKELIRVKTDDYPAEALLALQRQTIEHLNKRTVIIESLPTSNVRISHYEKFSEHHIFRWLGLTGDETEPRPTVCLGSDDPGIFSTSLRNEYAILSQVLRDDFKLSATDTIDKLRSLNRNGFNYRFKHK